MVAAVRVHKPGGPEALTYEDVQIAAPGQGQIKIKQHACGVNFIDAYFRMGMYPSPVGLPFIAGNESAGEVMARYEQTGYPSYVLLRKDGSVAWSFLGSRTPQEFSTQIEKVLAGG